MHSQCLNPLTAKMPRGSSSTRSRRSRRCWTGCGLTWSTATISSVIHGDAVGVTVGSILRGVGGNSLATSGLSAMTSHLIWKALLDIGTNPLAVFLLTVTMEIVALHLFFELFLGSCVRRTTRYERSSR